MQFVMSLLRGEEEEGEDEEEAACGVSPVTTVYCSTLLSGRQSRAAWKELLNVKNTDTTCAAHLRGSSAKPLDRKWRNKMRRRMQGVAVSDVYLVYFLKGLISWLIVFFRFFFFTFFCFVLLLFFSETSAESRNFVPSVSHSHGMHTQHTHTRVELHFLDYYRSYS